MCPTQMTSRLHTHAYSIKQFCSAYITNQLLHPCTDVFTGMKAPAIYSQQEPKYLQNDKPISTKTNIIISAAAVQLVMNHDFKAALKKVSPPSKGGILLRSTLGAEYLSRKRELGTRLAASRRVSRVSLSFTSGKSISKSSGGGCDGS